MKWLNELMQRIGAIFASKEAKNYAELIVKYAPVALPCIEMAARLTPTQIDDLGLAWMRTEYPRFFTGAPLTKEEMGDFRLDAAAGLLMMAHPGELSDTDARTAVQVRYGFKRAEERAR